MNISPINTTNQNKPAFGAFKINSFDGLPIGPKWLRKQITDHPDYKGFHAISRLKEENGQEIVTGVTYDFFDPKFEAKIIDILNAQGVKPVQREVSSNIEFENFADEA